MKKKIVLSTLIICFAFTTTGCASKPAQTQVEQTQQATPVEVLKTTKTSIENKYLYSGKVKPINEVNVFSKVQGTVDKVNFDIGDSVKQGDVLFSMDTTDIMNTLNTLNASLNTSEANINSAKTTLSLVDGASMQTQIQAATTALENAKIGLSNAKLNLDKAKTDYDNNKALFESNALSKNSFEQTERSYEQTKNAYSQAEVTFNQAKENYDITVNKMPAENKKKAEDGLRIAEASKQSALAQIEITKTTLNNATITSPIDGVVTVCNAKEDVILSQSAVPFTIIDMSKVNIEVSVSEQIINQIKVGDTVEVKISSISSDGIAAKISTINPAANASGTYDVKIEIENKDGKLKSGMLGEIYFTREKSDKAIVIPKSAVIEKNNEVYVFVEENGVAKKVIVEVGVDNGNEVEIASGLEENVNVIVKGQTYLADGDTIQVASTTKGE